MIVRIEKALKKLRDKSLEKKVAFCIEHVMTVESISEIKNLKILKGSDIHFRIRVGDYRIGLIINRGEIDFVRILHRKEIYRYFP
ncbi:MAG: hypothetical protein ABJA90_02000 [Ginsengibacter sp.]